MSHIRIVIVDEHAMLRAGLRLLIESQCDMRVVGEAATICSAVAVGRDLMPDVIITDLCMPRGTGVAGIQQLREACPDAHLLVLSMHDDVAYVRQSLGAGAFGYVVKSAVNAGLLNAIRVVSGGGVYVVTQADGDCKVRTPSRYAGVSRVHSEKARS